MANEKNDKKIGQNNLFGVSSTNSISNNFNYDNYEEYSHNELLSFEKELLGFYVSGHPLDQYKTAINNFTNIDIIHELAIKKNTVVQFAGNLSSLKVIQTKRNNSKMAFGLMEDFKGQIEIVIFSDSYEKYKNLLLEGLVIGIVGKLTFNRDKFSIAVEKVLKIEDLDNKKINNVHIKFFNGKIENTNLMHSFNDKLNSLEDNSGLSNVYFYLKDNSREVKLRKNISVSFSADILKIEELKRHELVDDVWVD